MTTRRITRRIWPTGPLKWKIVTSPFARGNAETDKRTRVCEVYIQEILTSAMFDGTTFLNEFITTNTHEIIHGLSDSPEFPQANHKQEEAACYAFGIAEDWVLGTDEQNEESWARLDMAAFYATGERRGRAYERAWDAAYDAAWSEAKASYAAGNFGSCLP